MDINDLSAAFNNNNDSQRPGVPTPVEANPTTDAYGAPITQQQQGVTNPPHVSTPPPPVNGIQQTEAQRAEALRLTNQLLDPNVENITVPDANQQQSQEPSINAAFQQLADTLTAAQNANQATNNQQLDANGKPVNPIAAIFDEAYGEDVDFSSMMQSEGDPEQINTQMQEQIKEKMQSVYVNAITQSLTLSQQLIDRKFAEFDQKQQVAQAQSSALSTMNERMPFTQQPEYAGLSQMLLDQAMSKTNNDVNKSVQVVEQLFRLNNPQAFDKPNNTRFGATPNSQNSGPTSLSLDTIESWMN